MKSIALIGAHGYIGSALLVQLRKNKNFQVTAVTRQNYSYWKKRKFDIVINAAMPAARFWALHNPYDDFVETVTKTAEIVYGWKYKKLVQISTISARSEKDSIYGRHKALAEELCHFGDNLIFRLTATYGETLKKGALIDMLQGKKIFVSGKSKYSFASLEFVSHWIANNLDKKGIKEIGAKNSISLEKIAKTLKLSVSFQGRLDNQKVRNPDATFPDAKNVIVFLRDQLQHVSSS